MLNGLCLPVGMSQVDINRFQEAVQDRVRVRKGETLFHTGDTANAIYGIRVGSIKTQLEDASGHVQVTGFLLPGEIVGLDGFLQGTHLSHAIALEDTEVCVARVDEIDRISAHVPALQNQLRRLTSQEIRRSQQLVMSLGVMRSEQRLAAFLVSMSQRLSMLGYSSTEFILRMSRDEIGSYLGLTLETVSRQVSALKRDGLIQLEGKRHIRVPDFDALLEHTGDDSDGGFLN